MQTGDDARNFFKYTPQGHKSSRPDDLLREWVAAIIREEAEAELYELGPRAHAHDDGGSTPPPTPPAPSPTTSPAHPSPRPHIPASFEDVLGRFLDDGGAWREKD